MSILAITKRQRDELPEGTLCEMVSIDKVDEGYPGLFVTVIPIQSFDFLHGTDYEINSMAEKISRGDVMDAGYIYNHFDYYDVPYLISIHENRSLIDFREFYNVKLSDLILDKSSLNTLVPSALKIIKRLNPEVRDLRNKLVDREIDRLFLSSESKIRLLNNRIKYSNLNPHKSENDSSLICHCCGKPIITYKDCSIVSGEIVCNSCLKNLLKDRKIFKCEFCGNYHEIERKYKHNMTKEEYEFSYAKCSCCGKEVVKNSYRNHKAKWYSSPTGNIICEECLTNNNINKYFIKRYHDTPRLKYYKDDTTNTTSTNFKGFGIELEIDQGLENSEKISRKIMEIMNEEVYCMRDGSVPKGIEIISMPHEEKSLYSMNWKKLFSMLKRNKYDSESSGLCGLHVHISREFFKDDSSIMKMIYFYQKFKKDVVLFSRRNPMSIKRWSSFYDGYDKTLIGMKDILNDYDKYGRHSDRYRCVNLQNEKTIEIRIMRGTIDFKDFIATLNFIIEIAKMSNTISEDKIDDYCEWLKNVDDNTIDYMKKRDCFKKIYKRR